MRRVLLGIGIVSVLFLAFIAAQFAGPLRMENMTAAELSKRFNYTGIPIMLRQQAADWNKGDLGSFAAGYKNSPDILFIGHKVSRGFDGMLAGYEKAYPTKEAMGTLTFTDLEVQPLDANFATTTGHYHLERTSAGGGNADGYFLLVLERTSSGWKIVRDDTTSLPAAGTGH